MLYVLISLQVSDIKKIKKSSPSMYRDVHALGYLATCGMYHLSLPRAGPLSLLFMHYFAFVHLIGLKNNDKQVA